MSGSLVTGIVGGVIGFFMGGPLGAAIGFGIGMAAGMIMPKMPGPDIGDAQKQTMQAGVNRPVVFGHPPPFAGNAIDGEAIARKIKGDAGGKGGSSSAQEPDKFLLTYAIRVCEGPISGYIRIWRDGVVVLDNRDPSDFPPGWEGYSKEVKAAQEKFLSRARLYYGTEDQLPDPALEALEHNGVGNTPYYRGTAYITLEDDDVSTRVGAIPDYRFEVSSAGSSSTSLEGYIASLGSVGFYYPLQSLPAPDILGSQPDMPAVNTPAIAGEGISFDSVLDGVGVSAGGITASIDYYTVMIKARLDAEPSVGSNLFGHWNNSLYGFYKYCLILKGGANNRRPMVGVNNMAGAGQQAYAPFQVPIGQAFTLALRRRGAFLDLIYNGGVQTTVACSGSHTGTAYLGSGSVGGYGPGYGFYGSVGHAVGINRALTDSELITLNGYMGFAPLAGVSLPDSPNSYIDPITGELINVGYGEVFVDSSVALADVETAIMRRVGVPLDAIDLTSLAGIIIPGFLVAEQSAASEVLAPLMQCYLHDLPEVDGQITSALRGQATTIALTDDDFLKSSNQQEYDLTPQNLEFPLKFSVVTQSPEADYAALPQTSLRFTPDVESSGEVMLTLAVPLPADSTAQLAEKLHKIAWAQAESSLERTLPEKYSTLVVSDTFYYRTRRWLITELKYDMGRIKIKCAYDPIGNYDSDATGIIPAPPVPPTGMSLGPTLLMAMNLPPLKTEHTLGFYIAIKGLFSGYEGADIYLSTDLELTYKNVLSATQQSIMGELAVNEPVSGTPITVTLYSGSDPLSNATSAQLDVGQNWAVVQRADTAVAEVIAFQTATPVSGNYELTNLRRGIKATVSSTHSALDKFAMAEKLYFIPVDRSLVGQTLFIRAVTKGTPIDANPVLEFAFNPPGAMLDPGPHQRIDPLGDFRIDPLNEFRETA